MIVIPKCKFISSQTRKFGENVFTDAILFLDDLGRIHVPIDYLDGSPILPPAGSIISIEFPPVIGKYNKLDLRWTTAVKFQVIK